jgi:hypothetical protein
MSIARCVMAAAVVAGSSGAVMAQTPTSSQTPAISQPAAVPVAIPTFRTPFQNHWIASGFVGTNFDSDRNDTLGLVDSNNSDTSINFGGEAAYLWKGFVGAEGLVDFAPSFRMDNLLFQDNPMVNTYMINGISAIPIGANNQVLPYFSAGIGAVQLRSTIFTFDLATASTPVNISAIDTFKADGTRFGGNVGGGLMGFSGRWGFRGDVRYYKTSIDNNLDVINNTPESVFAQGVLSGLAFWKVNGGVAFRW